MGATMGATRCDIRDATLTLMAAAVGASASLARFFPFVPSLVFDVGAAEPLLRLEVLLLPPPPSRLPSLLPPPTGAVAVATGLPPPAKEWLSSAPRPTVSGDMSPVEAEEATEAASIWKRRVLRGRFEGARGSPYPRRSSTRSPSLLAGNDCSTSALALLVRSPLQPSPQRR